MSVKMEVQQDIQLAQDGSIEAFARVIQLYERTIRVSMGCRNHFGNLFC
ncbi:hypothetical protein [Brevibacillus fortis]